MIDVTPKQIGRYRVTGILGVGGSATVYQGFDDEMRRPVAIKTLKPSIRADEHGRAYSIRFASEARAVANLVHPHVVQVFDVGTDSEIGPFIVMECVDGQSLKQVLREQGPLSLNMVCSIARELGSAIDAAHACNVIHRDIKPANVLVTSTGIVKLADFGIARLPDSELTVEGGFLGTPCYSAPETIRKGDYSRASDQFSFATVIYETLTAQRAFDGEDPLHIANQVLHHRPRSVRSLRAREVPAQVDVVLARAMHKHPESRFKSSSEFANALNDAQSSRRWTQSPRLALGALTLATLIVGSALAYAIVEAPDWFTQPFSSGDDATEADGAHDDTRLKPAHRATERGEQRSDKIVDAFVNAIADEDVPEPASLRPVVLPTPEPQNQGAQVNTSDDKSNEALPATHLEHRPEQPD